MAESASRSNVRRKKWAVSRECESGLPAIMWVLLRSAGRRLIGLGEMIALHWDDLDQRWCSRLPAANLPYKGCLVLSLT